MMYRISFLIALAFLLSFNHAFHINNKIIKLGFMFEDKDVTTILKYTTVKYKNKKNVY